MLGSDLGIIGFTYLFMTAFEHVDVDDLKDFFKKAMLVDSQENFLGVRTSPTDKQNAIRHYEL